jgi:hypothetical protein
VAVAQHVRLANGRTAEGGAFQLLFGFDVDPPLPSTTAGETVGPLQPLASDVGLSDEEGEAGASAAQDPASPQPEQVRARGLGVGGDASGARLGNIEC